MAPPHHGPSRRALLAAATATPALWLAGGCSLSVPGVDGGSAAGNRTAEDPDVVLLGAAVHEVDAMVALLQRAVRERAGSREGVRQVLRPVLAGHRRHARVLGDAAPDRSAASPDPSQTPSQAPSGTPSGAAEPLPRRGPALLAVLADAEQTAADAHLDHVGRSVSGRFAQLLASIAAAEAQYAAVFREAAR